MGFTHDPGPLPFTTIRRQQWANRTWVGEVIEIHGEHGCTMPAQPARVVRIYEGGDFDIHAHRSPNPYPPGTHLCAIMLEPAPAPG